jgi:ubiquinone/menaquinone biosynthesis C-methylase UbiE
MLRLAQSNVEAAGLTARIRLEKVNGRELGFREGQFPAVVSNSIIHHIPEPRDCFREMVRVCAVGGVLFVRDLLRPNSREELEGLVNLYATEANDHQRLLFANSLHAALTLVEVRAIVGEFGFPTESVQQTTDRHWTFAATKAPR